MLSALVGAIIWNLITWRLGLPSSSTHAIIGALTGVGIAAERDRALGRRSGTRSSCRWCSRRSIGFLGAFALMVGVLWLVRNRAPARTQRRFRLAQTASAAAMALGHGLQDAQKTMGIIVLALVAGGFHTGTDIPLWVKLSAATAISLGTYSGGWRIMRTLGRKIIELDPARGFVAESVASLGPLRQRVLVPRARLDHPHDHVRDHGRRRDQAASPRSAGASPRTSRTPGC